MRLAVTVAFLFFSTLLTAQTLVWEKVESRNPVAVFRPEAFTIALSGSIYVTGQYDNGDSFFVQVNGMTKYADTTLPGIDACMFLFKFNADGKFIKRQFIRGLSSEYKKLTPDDFKRGNLMLPDVASGNSIIATTDNKLLTTGFASGYRKKNYETDRTQGVFTAMLDTNLLVYWDKMYPYYFNSSPQKVLETTDGQFVILAYGHLGPRIMKISAKGDLITDTLLQDLPTPEDYDFDDTSRQTHLKGEATSFVATPTGYIFSGTAKKKSWNYNRMQAILIETDKNFKSLKKSAYTLFREKYSQYDFLGGYLAVNKSVIALTGIAQIGYPPGFTAFIDRKTFDTLGVVHFESNVFNYPGIVQTGAGKYAVAVRDHHKDAIQVHFIENYKIKKTITLNKYPIMEYVDMQVHGNHLYILGEANKGVYMAKVKF